MSFDLERSASSTFPNLKQFRPGKLKGFRRVFAHHAPIFYERGIAKVETKVQTFSMNQIFNFLQWNEILWSLGSLKPQRWTLWFWGNNNNCIWDSSVWSKLIYPNFIHQNEKKIRFLFIVKVEAFIEREQEFRFLAVERYIFILRKLIW